MRQLKLWPTPDRRPHRRAFVLQWHVTSRCNLRCSHCYQERYSDSEFDLAELVAILGQLEGLLEALGQAPGTVPLPGHINLTGGEPFCRPDFPALLDILAAWKPRITFSILTNGSFIDRAMARKLRRLRPGYVQLSIDGSAATHDRIRGAGDFKRVLDAVNQLRSQHLRTMISFTAHRSNFREFPEVAALARKLGVARLWADRAIPAGGAVLNGIEPLTPAQTREFFGLMAQARMQASRSWFRHTEIAMHRALQFLAGGVPYACPAGDTLLALQPNGDVYPCRRMPVRLGNIRDASLLEIYRESPFLRRLRDRSVISEGCEQCRWARSCRGGLRCLAYAVSGNPHRADPGCWRAHTGPSPAPLECIPCQASSHSIESV